MKKICDEAAAALEKTQKTMKKYYDVHRRNAPEFKVGDKVWLEGKDVTTDVPRRSWMTGGWDLTKSWRRSGHRPTN
jgi:hypothetical protein